MLADFRYALRALKKSPGFTLAAVLTLAVGIGANTTVFSLVSAVHFGTPKFSNPATLVDVSETSATRLCTGCGVGTSYPGFRDWQRESRSFERMAGYGEDRFVLSGDDQAETIAGAYAGAGLFSILAVPPKIGRDFLPDDDRAGAAPVVLLSHRLWQRRFGSAPDVLGRMIKVNGIQHAVIGVMPERFNFPQNADVWIPLELAQHSQDRTDRNIGVAARLAPGVTLSAADAEMKGIARGLEQQFPEAQSEWTAVVVPLGDDMASESGDYFWILLGAVSLVLLATCASLAGLLLARSSGRRKEMAVRAALGADRGRLARQLLTESVVVSLLGGVAGLFLSWWAIDLAAAGFTREAPYWVEFGVNGRVLAFCLGVSLLTGLIFGAVPAIRASRPNLNESLKEGAATASSSRSRQRFRASLVVVEFALALILLNGAGLMIKTFLRVSQVPPSYDIRHLLLSNVDFLGDRYADSTQVLRATTSILERLNAVPGVRAAGSNFYFLAGFGGTDQKIEVEGLRDVPDNASPRFGFAITPEYFRTLGLPLSLGRDFAVTDQAGGPPVAIVNVEMARRLWPGESALGKRIRLWAGQPWITVVGVVTNDGGEGTVDNPPARYVYLPLAQRPNRPIALMMRTPADPLAMIPTLRASVREVDADLPLENVRTAEAGHAESYWHVRLYAVFFLAFAVFALLLAAIGIYGIVAQTVVQRTHEIGIRVALGAERSRVLLLIVGDGARLAAVGLGLGLIGAVTLTRLMKGMLFNASPVDPLVLLPVSVLLFGVALLASWLPARRALRIDPMLALRSE
jgi:putative ABC transport system permease protein